jgi:L,D-peptidoglycan transpeptidase YkuD (ErfK/YbiS/YcfS/YnhG family)
MKPVQVRSLSAASTKGWVECGPLRLPCALGRTGQKAHKREGDGATPIGCWPMREVYHRADRLKSPFTRLPVRHIRRDDGWCDHVGDRNYNRRVRHPYSGSAERMWRDDALYDVVVVLGFNDRPRVQGLGSAIFMHVARDGFQPTAGCIALSTRDLLKLLRLLDRGTCISIRR